MGYKYGKRTKTVEVETCEAICDRCGVIINRADSLDDGYNPVSSEGEYEVYLKIAYAGKYKECYNHAVLCDACATIVSGEVIALAQKSWPLTWE